jgi:5'-nucleotidase (lipoprotein e(P4) family)
MPTGVFPLWSSERISKFFLNQTLEISNPRVFSFIIFTVSINIVMKKISLVFASFVLLQILILPSCFPPFEPKEVETKPDTLITDTLRPFPELTEAELALMPISEQAIMATLFQQRSAEFRALSYQAFNLARIMLERDLRDDNVNSPRAIIVDIDETLLDNSPHSAKCIENQTSYPDYWDEWCELGIAKALPGAVEFLRLARNYGVSIYYITNRREHLKEATMRNMRELGFPQIEDRHMMFRTAEAGKEKRRLAVARNHHISMLIGDNLNDFADVFENKSVEDRARVTDSLRFEFGRRFIVLPNAMYGDWEGALYNYNFAISDSAKMAIRRQWLESF